MSIHLFGSGPQQSHPSEASIQFRLFRESDLPEMMRLQHENLVWNLPNSAQADGFLSLEFGPDQIRQIHRSIPIIVAERGPSLAGFLMGTTLAESRAIPILARMIQCYEFLPFKGRPLGEYRSYVYGPVCVGRSARGTGVLQGLYGKCLEQLSGRFEAGVLFIARDNPRSFQAHRRKLQMEYVGDFEFNSKAFDILAFSIPEEGQETASEICEDI